SHLDGVKWPLRQPTNVIEAGKTEVVHLGSLRKLVRYIYTLEFFILEFQCPALVRSNSLHVASCSSGILVNAGYFNKNGSLLERMYTSGNVVDVVLNSKEISSRESFVRVDYDFGVKVLLPTEKYDWRPIHESIVIAAFIRSKILFPKGTFYNNINDKQWEYFRGIIENDDPSCLLFIDDFEDNRHFGAGIEWGQACLGFGDGCSMTVRTHRGDLQFLHVMGSFNGEGPQDTRSHILGWIEIMYKLACGDQGVSTNDPLGKHFPRHFDNQSTPT
ncbi:hypothetical protein BKA59DRAFT_399748, partial [Fusarium tricinctum]